MTAYASSLYYLRYEVQPCGNLRGILLIDLVTIRLGDDIGKKWISRRSLIVSKIVQHREHYLATLAGAAVLQGT